MSNHQILDIITVPIETNQIIDNYDRRRHIRQNNRLLIRPNRPNRPNKPLNRPMNRPNKPDKPDKPDKPVYKKFPSYLYDVKHHNLKIIKKHWKSI